MSGAILTRILGRLMFGACWEWRGATRSKGYGAIKVDGRVCDVHRLVVELCSGRIGEGLDVCHTCDNPRCCRPSHLFCGTRRDNVRDMIVKGRRHKLRGTDVPHAKLTPDLIAWAAQENAAGRPLRDLAADLGVCKTTLRDAIRGKRRWRHLQGVVPAGLEPATSAM